MANLDFNLDAFLPKHTAKILASAQTKQKLQGLPAPDYAQNRLNLSENINLFGSVGSDTDYSAFPDAQYTELKNELAELYRFPSTQIAIGSSVLEFIDTIFRSFLTPYKDAVLTFTPFDPAIKRQVYMNFSQLKEVELNSLGQIPLYKTRQNLDDQTKIILLSNANPITGLGIRPYDIANLLDGFGGLVVVDETYADFCTDKSLLDSIKDYPNLIVLQTFSHAYGLAGIQTAVAYAQPALIAVLEAMRPPYTVASHSQQQAAKAVRLPDYKRRLVEEMCKEKERVSAAIRAYGFVKEVSRSEANFLLVRSDDTKGLHAFLSQQRIDTYLCTQVAEYEQHLRLGIGNNKQNDQVLAAFQEWANQRSPLRRVFKTLSKTLGRASIVLGIFKKMFG